MPASKGGIFTPYYCSTCGNLAMITDQSLENKRRFDGSHIVESTENLKHYLQSGENVSVKKKLG